MHALARTSRKLKPVGSPRPIALELLSSKTNADRKRGKTFYLDLIKTQSRQMIDLGFLGSPSAEWLADTESQLEKLDLNTLQAIAHAAEYLLKETAKLPPD